MVVSTLTRVFTWPVLKGKEDYHVEKYSAVSDVEKLTAVDTKTGDVVKALEVYEKTGDILRAVEVIQGHGRLNWFYDLLIKGYFKTISKTEVPSGRIHLRK